MATSPPCIYIIELDPSAPARFYVGSTAGHTAECKFALHVAGCCLCRAGHGREEQRNGLVARHGVRLWRAIPVREKSREGLVREERRTAEALAVETGAPVWCDGTIWTP